ncbi:SpoIID/LytB domain-containing protein [Chlamydia abortus]|uniref:SpoIID/LytB domain-containing protein n=1 Tax=Chlamydia abortus TaxID=83555 RepID=UPI001117550D|nr:SpoIID/LytB domain-containing protein [Chlamydia abortus]
MKILKYILLGLSFSMGIAGYTEVKVSDTFTVQPIVSEPKIRVLLLNESTTALIEAKGPYRLYGDNTLLQHSPHGLRCAAHALYGGVRWGENFPGVQCLKIEPIDDSASLFVNGLQYKGALYIHKTDKHCILVTNELTVEEYLKSILSTKYLKELDKEALSACVILERTALYERLLAKNPQDFWHVTGDEDNYCGYGATKQFYGVEEAVDWTSRLIVDNPEGLIIDADGLLKASVDRLAIEGYNARQILEKFYKNADFVVIESWNDEANEIS